MRYKAKDLVDNKIPDYEIREMIVDRSYVSENDFADHMAGFIRCRLGLFSGMEAFSGPETWRDPAIVSQKSPVYLMINLIRAIDLPSGDQDGLSDPFVEFEHFGASSISTVCTKSLDPTWNQRIMFSTTIIEDQLLPLIVNVYDSDSDDMKKYDFLGRALVKLPERISPKEELNILPKPEWHDLQLTTKIKLGKIMFSLQLFVPDMMMMSMLMPLAYDQQKYRLKFKLLGIRNFQSSTLLPIKKPYIKLNMSVLRMHSTTATNLDFLTAESRTGNSNANFGEVISRSVSLPKNASLLPTISVRHC